MSVRPTLEAVGRAAGVSRATVSRVVNGSPKVSPEAREAVQRAIAELGYTPNRAARSLVTRRTDTIALLLSEPEARVFADPFFAAMMRGITAVTAEVDVNVVLLVAQDEAEHERARRYLRRDHVDGVVLMSLHGDDPLPTLLEEAGVPTVQVGRPMGDADVCYVDADNRGGARTAVEHLLGGGRRRIATIAGPASMCAGIDRLAGYGDALRAAGLALEPALVEHGDFDEDSGHAAMRRLLEREPGIDGVFAASDLMAVGALRAIRESGREVPSDVAVVGFDNSPVARHALPPLTTIRQPLDEMSRHAAELLLRRVRGEDGGARQVVCPTELVLRDSA
ncbi:MAG TPA: LacI family DNA-binding transcriptional regulator [Solirubrobacteraceae bacterium]|jgi:DNA-binding LacI/PurR family transcriptional regulator|nr:LacI family DNA-binding transcriptional regulator [Solirubrobacteraceae bacterium]